MPFSTYHDQTIDGRKCDLAYFRSEQEAIDWQGDKPGYVIQTTPTHCNGTGIWRSTIFTD